MPIYSDEVAPVGVKTVQYNPGGGFADAKLSTVLTAAGFSAAEIAQVKGIDIQVIAGTLYTTNDGSAASAASYQIPMGSEERIRNARGFLITQAQYRLFAAAGIDLRIRAWAHGQ